MSNLPRVAPPSRQPWQERAACAGEIGVLFYPPMRAEKKAVRLRREAHAISVCQQCPVREECLQYAIDHDERYGIWGGLTDRERRLALVDPD